MLCVPQRVARIIEVLKAYSGAKPGAQAALFAIQSSVLGGPRARVVCVQAELLITIWEPGEGIAAQLVWHMFSTGETYRYLGGDYYQRRDPARATKRLVAKLEALGHNVIIQPQAA